VAYINERGEIVGHNSTEPESPVPAPARNVDSLRRACIAGIAGWLAICAIIAWWVASAADARWYENDPVFKAKVEDYRVAKKAYDESSWFNRTFLQSAPEDPSSGRPWWYFFVFVGTLLVAGLVGVGIVAALFEKSTGQGLFVNGS
jgi:hypothetical protein